jgi:Cd2+/Zn2+-exporting ATPase
LNGESGGLHEPLIRVGVKAEFVFLTFGGHASLWTAIAAGMGVSLLVIFNALRLLKADSW